MSLKCLILLKSRENTFLRSKWSEMSYATMILIRTKVRKSHQTPLCQMKQHKPPVIGTGKLQAHNKW